MTDFNRNDDPYNRERDLRVVQKDSSLGTMAGIAVIVLLLLGGLLFYFNPGAVRTADNSAITTANRSTSSAPVTTPQRSPMTPSITPSSPSAPPAPSTTTPPAAPAQ